MNLRSTFILLFFILAGNTFIYSQVPLVTGQNICSDGSQKTSIGVSGISGEKFYVLYLDNNMLQVRRLNSKSTGASITFGEFSEEGLYTVTEFANPVENFPRSSGTQVKGSVAISPTPKLMPMDTLKIGSGEKINFVPVSNLPETSFSWTSHVKKGTVKGNTGKGNGIIEDRLTLEGAGPASVVYSITPYRSLNGQVCTGETHNLTVKVTSP